MKLFLIISLIALTSADTTVVPTAAPTAAPMTASTAAPTQSTITEGQKSTVNTDTTGGTTKAGTKGTTKEPIGGKKDADINDKTVQEMVAFAFELIGTESNSPHAYKMGKVLKAQTQVVNGIDYYLTFEMSETDCVKVTTDLTNCTVIVNNVSYN